MKGYLYKGDKVDEIRGKWVDIERLEGVYNDKIPGRRRDIDFCE